MMRLIAALAGLAALTACAPAPVHPGASAPDALEQCRASQHQSYVGKNRSTLPSPPAGETWRVTCTTCPVTMDYNPGRLNVFFNERTNIIEQVRCG